MYYKFIEETKFEVSFSSLKRELGGGFPRLSKSRSSHALLIQFNLIFIAGKKNQIQ